MTPAWLDWTAIVCLTLFACGALAAAAFLPNTPTWVGQAGLVAVGAVVGYVKPSPLQK